MSAYVPGRGMGSPCGEAEIAAAREWSATAPSYADQLRDVLARAETFDGEHETAREMLKAIEGEVQR